MTRIGIMQGRLVPPADNRIQCFPRDNWEAEFELAAKAHLDCIEWIYDLYGADVNPIATNAGVDRMRALSTKHGVQVLSLCADYFMEKPLVRTSKLDVDDRLATLEWLMQRCQLLSMNRIVLPFVDASRIDTDAEFDSVCEVLGRALKSSEKSGIEIHLETSLAPDRFAKLLARLPHPMLKVNYDAGNSSSLGYQPRDEFMAYGARVGSIHIKDRLFGGSTVPLGTGDVNFRALSESINTIGFKGDFILQVARDIPGDEVNWATRNREFVIKHFRSVL